MRHEVAAPGGVWVITCAVLELEVEAMLRDRADVVGVTRLPQGLHNEPDRLREELQLRIDEAETCAGCGVIVLVYGLCSRGTEGLRTRRCRLVIPRAHDCITLLLGSKERYAAYVSEHPGTYWYSPGWNAHHVPPGPKRYELLRREYVEKYGEDNADFLMEMEQGWFKEYNRATYVHLSIGATDEDRAETRRCADWLEWTYDEVAGDPGLMEALLSGAWDEERFLVLEPGEAFVMTADERVIERVKGEASS
ncbi:hypothetical protein Pan265_12880 [Mucisphaera calidilacus]|uniref:DUF1638 domain-containing protein n=2 Tax=Mucisphaera calidilacus TaxID=2527982 RepID=A0A518BWT6_9BACT|nr:hypothetical protein Pan265_12880 [Mucisphaera calidilacus]